MSETVEESSYAPPPSLSEALVLQLSPFALVLILVIGAMTPPERLREDTRGGLDHVHVPISVGDK